ncbi:hypothetical protein ACN4EK_08405 [Pantanalinema rosaneae CENA516]|uniref:hypothetical protein n=1 Tax=Pantanalinema rosaneae TaxID=1620701 RepID=UPI003D6F4A4A
MVEGWTIDAKPLVELVVFTWLFLLVNTLLLGQVLSQMGINSRLFPGLWYEAGILPTQRPSRSPAQFLPTWIVFNTLLLLRGTQDWLIVTLIAVFAAGVSDYLFTRSPQPNYHSILYSYLGFLLVRGYLESSLLSALLSIALGCLYNRLLWDMTPLDNAITWKHHLFGFTAGVAAAHWLEALTSILPASALW